MKTEPPDQRLARLFRDARLADEASAPDLARLLERNPRRAAPPRRRLALPAAALAIVAVLVVVLVVRPARRPRPDAIAIADWQSPTDSLLQTSGSELLSSLPQLVSSDLAVESRVSPELTKGVSR
jgi:hypothetical protein